MIKTYANDYSHSAGGKIDMTLAGKFIVPRKLIIPENLIDYLDSYPNKIIVAELIDTLSRKYNIDPKNLMIGAGSNGIIQNLMHIFFKDCGNLVVPEFSFEQAEYAATSMGAKIKEVEHKDDFSIDFNKLYQAVDKDTKAVFLCNPNNPTGIYEDPNTIIDFAESIKQPVIVSEASFEYVQEDGLFENKHTPNNLIKLRSFSKAYGLSGLRVGYAQMSNQLIEKYKQNTTRFETSSLSILLAKESLDDPAVNENIIKTNQEREKLQFKLKQLGINTTKSKSSCFMSTSAYNLDFYNKVEKKGISLVKVDCSNTNDKYFRVAVQDENTNNQFIEILSK